MLGGALLTAFEHSFQLHNCLDERHRACLHTLFLVLAIEAEALGNAADMPRGGHAVAAVAVGVATLPKVLLQQPSASQGVAQGLHVLMACNR